MALDGEEVAGFAETHLPAKSTLVAIALGLMLYFVSIRRRIIRGEAGPPTADPS